MADRRDGLLALADRVVTFSAEKVDQIEVLIQDTFNIGANVALGQIKTATKTQEAGAAIRCVVGKRLGCAFTNRLDQATLEETVKQAISAAETSTTDETWSNLPMKTAYGKVRDVWDDSLLEREPGVFVDLLTDVTRKVMASNKDIIVGQAGVGVVYGWSAYANSNGVSISDRGTRASVYLGVVAPTPTGGMTPSIFESEVSRNHTLDTDAMVNRAVHYVQIARQPAKGETGSGSVIMIGNALGSLLYYSFFPSVLGENVVRGKSMLASRRGDQIASKSLSVIDDGLQPGAFRTSLFDDEGVPRQTTSIIEKGKLGTFLWDNYWANRHGEQSTGNAQRNLRTGVVGIQPSTIVVPTGRRSLEDLIGDVNSGYLIKGFQGAHSSNQDTGDFSVVGNPCFRIENGQLTGCVHGLMLAGNAFQLVKKVDSIGADSREFFLPNTAFYGPSIRFNDLQVVAKGD